MPSSNIGDYLVSSRSFEEYQAMFALPDDVKGPVLDCPGGGSSFTASANARGIEALAVHPVYELTPDDLSARIAAEVGRGRLWASENAQRYVWDFYGDVAGHTRVRSESAALFGSDYRHHPELYRCARLPELPFPDNAFGLVLSSHLLFTYADRLDVGFHVAALLEMVRVSFDDVRVFPLLDMAGRNVDAMVDAVTAELAKRGIEAQRVRVRYEFQRGGDEMLVVRDAVRSVRTRGDGGDR
ncbi:MAG: hypothetical protein ICV72_09515 [Aldersonia sp.]|nr:hypothetical protein [Aldersonia sp.]